MNICFYLKPAPETDINDMLDLIKYGNSSFPELQEQWKATVQYRLQRISLSNSTTDIINEWKNYTIPLGYKLVSRKQKKILITINKFIYRLST